MKRTAPILLTLALVLLASCGTPASTPVTSGTGDTTALSEASNKVADTTEEVTDDTASESTSVDPSATYICTLDNGVEVEIGGSADALIASLGEPKNYMEAPSCVHPGFDKVYTFEGFSITTSPDADGKQYIAELTLDSDAVAIGTSLMVGCDVSELEPVFGSKYEEQFGVRKYQLSGAAASVIVDGDSVATITISSVK